jgi:alkanesulfonate monooxygenase SsuD/methylene tetrahydromethanopterin reductase-like flavin-dependent oxidoreductase (luciferase family)
VKLGFFFDLRNPEQWRRPWADVYAQALERVEQIDTGGGGAVWFTEHHLWDDGYLPQPLTFAAAAAARTRRVSIGTAILLAPLRHALHVAEEAAVVDVLSAGRLELGLGAGWAQVEFDAFGVERRGRFDATDALLSEIRRLFDEGIVTPPPVQRPVPLWLGYQSEGGARRAGKLGAGLLSLDRSLVETYTASFDPTYGRPRMGGLVNLVVADDPDAVRERLLPHAAYQAETYRRARHPQREPVTVDTLRDAEAVRGSWPSGPGVTVCTPDDAVRELRARTDGMPVEHVYLWATVAAMPDDIAARHIELACGHVAPALAA